MTQGKSTSELHLSYNGWWSKLTLMVVGGVCTAVILGGLGGIIVTVRSQDASAIHVTASERSFSDHEARIRSIEKELNSINAGVQVLLERTKP